MTPSQNEGGLWSDNTTRECDSVSSVSRKLSETRIQDSTSVLLHARFRCMLIFLQALTKAIQAHGQTSTPSSPASAIAISDRTRRSSPSGPCATRLKVDQKMRSVHLTGSRNRKSLLLLSIFSGTDRTCSTTFCLPSACPPRPCKDGTPARYIRVTVASPWIDGGSGGLASWGPRELLASEVNVEMWQPGQRG